MTETLVFGDNGHQVYFEGEKHLLLNPYLESGGQRYASGWVWFYLNDGGEWRCLTDPDDSAPPQNRGCIGAFSLRPAVAYAQVVTGLSFDLVGAPTDLPDRYPIHEMWR